MKRLFLVLTLCFLASFVQGAKKCEDNPSYSLDQIFSQYPDLSIVTNVVTKRVVPRQLTTMEVSPSALRKYKAERRRVMDKYRREVREYRVAFAKALAEGKRRWRNALAAGNSPQAPKAPQAPKKPKPFSRKMRVIVPARSVRKFKRVFRRLVKRNARCVIPKRRQVRNWIHASRRWVRGSRKMSNSKYTRKWLFRRICRIGRRIRRAAIKLNRKAFRLLRKLLKRSSPKLRLQWTRRSRRCLRRASRKLSPRRSARKAARRARRILRRNARNLRRARRAARRAANKGKHPKARFWRRRVLRWIRTTVRKQVRAASKFIRVARRMLFYFARRARCLSGALSSRMRLAARKLSARWSARGQEAFGSSRRLAASFKAAASAPARVAKNQLFETRVL